MKHLYDITTHLQRAGRKGLTIPQLKLVMPTVSTSDLREQVLHLQARGQVQFNRHNDTWRWQPKQHGNAPTYAPPRPAPKTQQQIILDCIYQHPGQTVRQIAGKTGLLHTSVSANIVHLRKAGKIHTRREHKDSTRNIVFPGPPPAPTTTTNNVVPLHKKDDNKQPAPIDHIIETIEDTKFKCVQAVVTHFDTLLDHTRALKKTEGDSA